MGALNYLMEHRQKFLLLDRDGVINEERSNYVLSWEQFKFKSDFVKHVGIIKKYFQKVVVITNQSCVGRGLISREKLDGIHRKMLHKIAKADGHVDSVYYSVGRDMSDPERKPNLGLLEKLKVDYPTFDPSHAIMIGNRGSDMLFAKLGNITGIHYTDNGSEDELPIGLAPWKMANWGQFDGLIREIIKNESDK